MGRNDFPLQVQTSRAYLFLRAQLLSLVQLFATPWTAARQAPLSTGFSRQEHWSGLPCPPQGNLPDPEIEPMSAMALALKADSLPPEPPGKPRALCRG